MIKIISSQQSKEQESVVQSNLNKNEEKTIQIKPEIRFYEKLMINILRQGHIPNHIAFIMDGNRRFAQRKGLEKSEGHFSGFVQFKRCCEWCFHLGVKEMTVFAFALENFNRSKQEVNLLMNLAQNSLRKLADQGAFLHQHQIRVKICGDLKTLPNTVQQAMREMEELTKQYSNLLLNICFAYNSSSEIESCTQQIIQKVADKELDVNKLDQQTVMDNLQIKTYPDILIRTSNEIRLSNFLIFQSTNTQIIFIKENWPEISIFSIVKIIIQYQLHLRKQKQVQKALN